MDIIKIIGIGLISLIIIIIVKQYRPEFVIYVSIIAGAIILMHTVAQDNAEAIPQFIKDAKAQGYTFGSLDDLVLEYEKISPY